MKKMIKRSLALGAIMAFVITGSAMAGSIGTTTINGEAVTVNPSGEFTVGADGDVVKVESTFHGLSLIANGDRGNVLGKSISINSIGYRGLQIANGATVNVGNKKTENVIVITSGDFGVLGIKSNINIDGKEIVIDGGSNSSVYGQDKSHIKIGGDSTEIVNIKTTGSSTVKSNGSDIVIIGKNITLDGGSNCGVLAMGKTVESNVIAGNIYIGNNNTEKTTITANGAAAVASYYDGGSINVLGKNISIEATKGRGLEIAFGSDIQIGDSSTQETKIKAAGDIGVAVLVANADFNGKMLYIESTKDGGEGIHVANNTTDSTSPNLASVNVNTENTYIKADAGLVAMSQGQLTVNSNITVDSKDAIITRGNAVTKINEDGKHTTQLNGDINFNYNKPTSGTKIDAEVVVNLNGKDSYWNGNTKISWTEANLQKPTEDLLKVTNTQISLSNGAQWNVIKVNNKGELSETGSALTTDGTYYHALNNLKLDGGIVNLEKAEDQTVEIENIEGKGKIVVGNKDNSLKITKKNSATNLTVGATTEYSKELAKGDIAEGLQQIANQVVDNTTAGAGKSAADNVAMAETGVVGETTAKVDKDGNVIVASIDEKVNSSNAGIAQMGSVALMTWRQENNDMNKRLGELRNSKGEHGVWTRMTRGESDFEGIKNQYNSYQIGYDEKLSTDKSWTVGAALTYTDGESSFDKGTGENTHKGFAIYGSKLNEDGSFIDLIAKYARLEHEFDAIGGAGSGEYDTNGYSVSAEYGKRFEQGNGFWVEPQVELTYGKVGSASYKTSEGVKVQQDGMDSLVGRVGFSLGKDIKQGNVYVRASYLYDFDGETSMSFSDGYKSRTIEQDLGGGWFEVGVGTNYNLSDATYLYLDVEKTYGGDVATPWQWNAGVRYSF